MITYSRVYVSLISLPFEEILTNDSLRALLAKNDSIPSQQVWSIDWILRYAITIKGRGVIREKGYFLNASANAES
jgi:hypothetical protein